jgi:exodeoxyribonuclease VII large subunit
MIQVPEQQAKLSVSGLVGLLQEVVEGNFVRVTVEGEVSNFAAPASGHWYFTLKDDRAQLRCVMFRGHNRLVKVRPRDGMLAACSGSVTVYVARGELQLVVEQLHEGGKGRLQAAFEELKIRLAAEGLFAEARKRPLPAYPQSVGIVTSASGAAIHDILNVMRRRAPGVRLLLRPVRVQGDGAAGEIAAAIDELNRFGGMDVLIVGRGGGSLEDLWAFNEEVVARAIAASATPVIAAVGHETDLTIADFVADLRAPTPSAAAELVARGQRELETHLDHLIIRLRSRLSHSFALVSERLDGLEGRLRRAARDLEALPQRVDELDARLLLAMHGRMRTFQDRLAIQTGRLDALSPLRQLERGLTVVSRQPGGRGLTDAAELTPGDALWLRFARGQARATIDEVEP